MPKNPPSTEDDFKPTDPLLHNEKKGTWWRFVPSSDQKYMTLFETKSSVKSLPAAKWECGYTIPLESARSVWDSFVADGFVRYTL